MQLKMSSADGVCCNFWLKLQIYFKMHANGVYSYQSYLGRHCLLYLQNITAEEKADDFSHE